MSLLSPTPTPAAIRLLLHGHPGWGHGPHADGPLQPLERKHAALLAWLWLEGPTSRSRLAGLLWPEVPEERARGNLRQRLLKLRQDAGEVVADNAGTLTLAAGVVVLPPNPPGTPLLQALAFDDCEAFARWLDTRREAERERRKREWLAEVREATEARRLDDALYAADQLLQTDRESEEAFRVLMEVHYLRGDVAAALAAWDRCRDMLRQLYGVAPSAATEQLGQTLLEADRRARAGQAAAWAPAPSAHPPLPLTVLRPPRLVGRQAELAALVQGWQAGRVLAVAGEAGVGKTRLLADWQATLAPAACASAAARPGDALRPYAALSRLVLAAVDRFAPPLGTPHAVLAMRLLPRLAALAGQQAEPLRTDHERSQALQGLARLLADAATAGCAACVFDDLHWADPASLEALRVLAAEPAAGSPVLRWALAWRSDDAGPALAALQAALAPVAVRVDLAPLSVDDSTALLASLELDALDHARWAPQIWQQVGGHPAFLLESVKLLLSGTADGGPPAAARAGTPAPLPLPAGVRAVVQRRVALLSAGARRLAALAAVAGSSYSSALAAAALGCSPADLAVPLLELQQRQVFQGRQFVHEVIASTIGQQLPADDAASLHRLVASHLAAHRGDPARTAQHWLAAGAWQAAGDAFRQAARAARGAALANAHAALLDQAIAAYEHDPACHDALFDTLAERTSAFESQGHEGLRPQLVARLQALARTEVQQLEALNHHCGWLTNLAQPVDEPAVLAAIDRALAVRRPDLSWQLSRMLAWQWAMRNRADDGLALIDRHQAWVDQEASLNTRAEWRLARANIFAFGDRLPEAIAEGRQAMAASIAAGDWPEALPAMSNLGVMHYWRGEYDAAHDVLSQARAQRERLYGGSGSGIKIDIHLGAVLYEMGRIDEAAAMLGGAVAEMLRWPDNEYRRTECLLADNHLAQMWIAVGRPAAAAEVLAHDASGVADRFYGRRLTLRLRWQRLFGTPDAALRDELQALAARVASPFNRTLMALELSRHQPPAQALAQLATLHAAAVVLQRPGLQLHVAVLAARAALAAGLAEDAAHYLQSARSLAAGCAPFDMPRAEVQALLGPPAH